MSRLRLALARFHADRSGSVAVIFGLGCLCFFVIVGLAVDTTRYYNLASKIQDSLDAATLAGAKRLDDDTMSDADIVALTRRHFDAEVATLGVRATEIAPLEVAVDRSGSTVEATSQSMVKSMFGPLVMLPREVKVVRTSKVVYKMDRIELAMVLDITGSMYAKNKLNDLKAAASGVIDELFKKALNENSIRIAVAPYSAAVNAGALADAVSLPGSYPDTCVIERMGSDAATDAPPSGSGALGRVTSLPYGSYSCPSDTVLPLLGKSGAETLKDTIANYTALGSTAGHIGAAWGWYLLSPAWAGVLPAESVPAAYDDKKITKTMLIMTDGLFNTSYKSGPGTDMAQQTEESYTQFQALCTGAKAKGITIYAVGFDLSDARAMKELEQCASSSANFFDAKTGTDLNAAFKAVADNLNILRIAG